VPFTSADDDQDKKSATYTVLVGAQDDSVGATVNGFFPDTLRIHVGDTVQWQRNASELHTVTFLVDMPLPPFNVDAPPGLPSPVMRNPLTAFPVAPKHGRYDGTTFATSGIFGPDGEEQFEVDAFDLTFTKAGTYNYVCVVHGARMPGQIIVVDRHQDIPSPREVDQEARRLITEALEAVPLALALAEAEVPPPTQNDDGTTTFYVLVGYSVGQLDLMYLFPDDLTVHPGDTVEWIFSMEDVPPHTITFLNGNPSPDDVIPWPQDNGPPLLLVNPELLFPQNADQPLTRQGIYSSGRLVAGDPPPSFSLQIGDIRGEEPYQCLIHDSSGMLATLQIVPR
jgi:plastocyanin